MKEKQIKKVFLQDLPKKGKFIDWMKSKNYKVKFIYDDIEGWLEIADIKRKNNDTLLGIRYLNNELFYIIAGHFKNAKIGELLGVYSKKHRYNIGEILEVSTGRIKVIEQIRNKNNEKEYIFECLECGWKRGTIDEYRLKNGLGCTCCTNHTAVLGINTIWDTDPWMIKYFKNPENAKTRTFGCNDEGLLQCPICKTAKDNVSIAKLYTYKNIYCQTCKDGFSYSEKFIHNLLKQLNLQSKRHKCFDWSKKLDINNQLKRKEYDFYFELNGEQYLCEAHGLQHYEECKLTILTLEEEQNNDEFKKQLALSNGIKEKNYIVIDCRKSELDWIKQNILQSRLTELFDLGNINWEQCEEEALSSYVSKACEYYNQGIEHVEISNIMGIGIQTIMEYLKRGKEKGLCNYENASETKNKKFENIINLWKSGVYNTTEINKRLNIPMNQIYDYLNQAEKEGLIEYKKLR